MNLVQHHLFLFSQFAHHFIAVGEKILLFLFEVFLHRSSLRTSHKPFVDFVLKILYVVLQATSFGIQLIIGFFCFGFVFGLKIFVKVIFADQCVDVDVGNHPFGDGGRAGRRRIGWSGCFISGSIFVLVTAGSHDNDGHQGK